MKTERDGTGPADRDVRSGILSKITPLDRSPVAVPVLAPHLDFRLIGKDRTLLVSESLTTLLRGTIYGDILGLLDGRRERDDIVAALRDSHATLDVRAALTALTVQGYVVSGEHTMERGRAAYWSALGASPRWAEERLAASRVAVTGDNGRLARHLAAMAVDVVTNRPALSVTICDDYLDEGHADLNRRQIESGLPWMLVRPRGLEPLFGPIFRPAQDGGCWVCLTHYLRNHQEVRSYLCSRYGARAAPVPLVAEPAVQDAVYGLVAAEIAKWLVLEDGAPLHRAAITLRLDRGDRSHHPVRRRPQCATCGDEALSRPDRPPVSVRLRSSPNGTRNCAGLRSVSPEATLARYGHLVSPISGVVTRVERTTDMADPWLHVHMAGANLALRIKSLSTLRWSLRNQSSGKGSTAPQSAASALCEAVERYSGAFHGEEIRRRKRYSDFAAEGEAIHPNEVQLFSDRQLDHADRINAREHPFNVVPARFDTDALIDWSPVWSLSRERHRYLPTSLLYGMTPEQRGGADLCADSNGCAAGNTLEEAILQGFLELVERDAFAVWWYNRLCRPSVDLESFGDDYLASAQENYRKHRRDMWVLDVTADLGIPVFVAISRRHDAEAEDIAYGAGAHFDPQIAATRAVCEMNQFLTLVPDPESGNPRYVWDNPMCLQWWKTARAADHPYLVPAPGAMSRCKTDYPVPDTADLREVIEHCRGLVEARGMEFLVLDQTRPDVGMPVARVVVPGLRQFWERFAPGRLYDVPVEMGWRKGPLAETALNPLPVIL